MEAILQDSLKKRWSPRAFLDREIDNDKLMLLFEAARWAPSSMNEQPWHYFYAYRDEPGFNKMLDCLVPQNREWAKNASVLLLSLAKTRFRYNSKPNRHAMHDTGASNASLAIQAASMGLQVHQMGGFNMAKTLETFNISAEDYEPVSFIAVGYPGDPEMLNNELKERELAPRQRKSIKDIITKV